MDNLDYAYKQLERLDIHTFLTGDAGTGKTTLMRKFIDEHDGECLVCAPSGIAAINIGGVTIHNLFHFPGRMLAYNNVKKLDPIRDRREIEIFQAANYLVIDEISMVRADLMDQIAWFLHKNSEVICGKEKAPFAGLKLIMVGDLNQLPPVAQDDEQVILTKRYKSNFFFDAACWDRSRLTGFETITLTKIWRQSDPVFIEFLNKIKNQKCSMIDIEIFNYQVGRGDNGGVMLCATNAIVSAKNQEGLMNASGKYHKLIGKVTGNFTPKNFPVDKDIEVKIGCKVMIVRNCKNKTYVNGSMGILTDVQYDRLDRPINIIVDLNTGETVIVPMYKYDQIEYTVDNGKLSHKVVGSFEQFPIKLAYALSIHKSQGQTFDKVMIDMGRGAFAHGMTYVALSRCKTKEGISLERSLTMNDLIYDKDVKRFMEEQLNKITI